MGAINRFAAWLLTENGKKFSFYSAGTLSAGILFGTFLPQTIFLDQYKDIVHLYKKGFSASLTPALQNRFQKALDLAEVPEEDKSLFKPFPYYGFNIFSAGSTYSRFGVIVGLPVNFFYESEADVDKTGLKLNEASILWETDEGELLLKSYVMSENAQLYAMAHEIKFGQTPKLMINTLLSTVAAAMTYGISHIINQKHKLYAKPLAVRLILYFLVCSFTIGNYVFIKDMMQIYYEGKIDEELKAKSPILAKGGLEFYSKMVMRNVALRQLMDKEGERKYSTDGNEIHWFRNRHLSAEDRKAFFQKKEVKEEVSGSQLPA